jgi:pimeloyl-ACP methyl ester carboxylesterase
METVNPPVPPVRNVFIRRNHRLWLVVTAAVIVAVVAVPTRMNRSSTSSANDKTGDGAYPLPLSSTPPAPTPASNPSTIASEPVPTPKIGTTTTTTTTTTAPTKQTPASPTATVSLTVNDKSQKLPLVGTANGVAYYHCPAVGDNDSTTKDYHIVLLHGSSFSKENWKKVGILGQFCAVKRVSVTALDLNNGSDHIALKNVLDALVKQVGIRKPVVLVTPSASGYTIADWLQSSSSSSSSSEIQRLPTYVAVWVPVAPTLSTATDAQIVQGLGNTTVRTLAIHGSRDTSGARTSARLKRVLPNTKVVELIGGHPVYLQSPDEFVQAILDFLGL